MGQLWVPDAIRLEPSYEGGTSDYPEAAPRAVAHTTESPAGAYQGQPDYWFWKMHQVLKSKSAEPTLLYDPRTDKLGQYFPFNRTGRALRNHGGRRSNRVGKVCIQIEFVGYASRPFTRDWEPGPNFRSMMSAIGSWEIPDAWPSGHPPAYPTERDERSSAIWYGRGGWFGHSQVPGNYHGDPGAIGVREFFEAQKTGREYWPAWCSYPGRDRIGKGEGASSGLNLLIKAALIAHGGYGAMGVKIDQKWDNKAQERVDKFKDSRSIGEDGIGPDTWKALGTMPSAAPDFPGPKAFELGSGSSESLVGQAVLVLQGFGGTLGSVMTKEHRPAAVRALRRFQISEPRLSGDADGVWGPLSWKLAFTDND